MYKKKDAGRESLWALSTVNGQYFALRITNLVTEGGNFVAEGGNLVTDGGNFITVNNVASV